MLVLYVFDFQSALSSQLNTLFTRFAKSFFLFQKIDGVWKLVTEASFVLVARDPLNVGSAFVNPLIAETDEEKRLIAQGEENKRSRYPKYSKN